MKKNILFCLLLIFPFKLLAEDEPFIELNGVTYVFHFDGSEEWKQVYVTNMTTKEVELASNHELAEPLELTEQTPKFIRAWLTTVDNGVNGNKNRGEVDYIPGAPAEAMSIFEKTTSLMDKFCKGNDKNWSCEQLGDLRTLSHNINREAEMRLHARRVY